MNERAQSRRDFIQNITIVLLSISFLLLFTQTHLFYLGYDSLSMFSGSDVHTGTAVANPTEAVLTAPVRVAVTGPYGRYGNVSLTTVDEQFEPLRGLLEQALNSCGTYSSDSASEFFSALQSSSIYYDFLSPMPLSVVTTLVHAQDGLDTIFARSLLLSVRRNETTLYAWDGDHGYFRCSTALSPEDLTKVIAQYELDNALFSPDSTEESAQVLARHTLLLREQPALPELTSQVPLTDSVLLLSSLGFNPNTQNRYPAPDGTNVILEGDRSLRIRTDGTILYQGANGGISVNTTGNIPTLSEAVSEVGTLLRNLLPYNTDEATLYLESARQNNNITTLHFGYQLGGIPIRFSDGQSAAQVTLSGATLSNMTFRPRQYTATGTTSALLPLRQALAIAAQQEGAELSIGYIDNGTDVVSAQWLAD